MSSHKSLDEFVSGLYAAMFSDIVDRYPDLQTDSGRDYKRLLSAIDEHGIRFALETLPAFGKHFDMCLANGRLSKSGLTHFRSAKKCSPIPRLFKGLLLRVFDSNGVLRSIPDHNCICFVRQLCSAVKRFRVSCPDSSTWKQIDEFYRIDKEVALGSHPWDSDEPWDVSEDCGNTSLTNSVPEGRVDSLPSFASHESERRCLATIQLVADIVSSQIGVFDPTAWRPRHGPGAVSDSKGFKYDFPNWPRKLDAVFPYDVFAFANAGCWADSVSSSDPSSAEKLEAESTSRLIAVPKSFSGPRLIASEPTSHQWCQQIIRDFMTSRIKDTCIRDSVHFRDQSPNQSLAREASRSGSHSTIDLSNASDRVSCSLVERMFRKNPSLLRAFHACRTRWISQTIDRKSPDLYKIRKFSTMGSAVTFPVQTYLFTMISVGCVLYSRGIRPSISSIRKVSQEVRVFGDDIIVPITCHGIVTEILTLLGLKVNPTKTFCCGYFRESCGYDAYDGQDVTKVSIMSAPSWSAPESILSSVEVHNNLFRRGYLKTAEFVRRSVESLGRSGFREVPIDSGLFGWNSFYPANPTFKTKWDSRLHRRLIYTTIPHSVAERSPVEKDSALLQYFTEIKSLPISHEVRIGLVELRSSLKLKRGWVPIDY
jgi:hypothetical protein